MARTVTRKQYTCVPKYPAKVRWRLEEAFAEGVKAYQVYLLGFWGRNGAFSEAKEHPAYTHNALPPFPRCVHTAVLRKLF